MSKPIKYTLLALGALIVFIVTGVAIFALTFDPNRYKGEIERLAKEQTGRTLRIKGDIKLAFWPSLGAQVFGVTFSEKGSERNFVSFDSARASVKLMPLLGGQYIVDTVSLAGFNAHIVKGKDGRFNFSDLVEQGDKKPAPEKQPKDAKSAPVVFDIGGVSIERASVAYTDLQAGQEYTLEDLRLKTGRIAQNAEGKLELGMVARRKAPPLQANLALDGRYKLDAGKLSADVNGKLDESTVKAKFVLAEPYEFDASIDRINLDRYLGAADKPAAKAAAKSSPPSSKKEEDTPVDLSALKAINAKGRLQVGALEVRGLKLAEVNAQVNAANGRVAVAPHSAKLYEGSISGELAVDANKNHVAVKEQLQNVSIGPILRDFANQERLEGRGNVALDVTTAGATVSAMKRALNGTAKVQLRDGAVKGINLGEILRKASTALGGSQGEASAGDNAGKMQQTDFTELSASFTIKNGIAHNEDLDAKAPAFRLGGAGDINIPASSLDYVVKASIVATSRGQGGRERDNLAGLTVPVKLSGSFDDLKYQVDMRGMAGAAAKSQAGARIKEEIEQNKGRLEERLGGKLKGLLGR
jgi:AsmA protein